MVLIMITGDFLGMSLTTDNVRGSAKPNSWQIGHLTVAGLVMGLGELVFCTAVLVFGAYRMGYDIGTLRTLAFVVIVFGNQATTYNNRERRQLWASRPSLWLAASSVVDIAIASTLAVGGIAMTRLPAWPVAATFAAAVIFAFLLDLIKVPVFARLGFAPDPRDRPVPHATQGIAKPEATTKAPIDLSSRIAKRAYEIYEQGGRKDGSAVQNWQMAESEIRVDLAKAEPAHATTTGA
jgi:H+-transporting ATPase